MRTHDRRLRRAALDAEFGLVDDDSPDGARRPPAVASTRVISLSMILNDRIAQKHLARAGVVALLRDGVLGSGVNVTHAPLQWRALVERGATTEREACIGDMSRSSRAMSRSRSACPG